MKNVKSGKLLLLLVVLPVLSVMLWGCPKKADLASSQESQEQLAAAAEAVKQDEARKAEEAAARELAAKEAEGLKPIHFDFDRADIREDARTVLASNAAWLRSHPEVKIRIEGNCDDRGTAEYNQALGQRRAKSAQKYLADLGVSAGRVALLSYGKEKPICGENTDECRQKNRRDDFVVLQ